MRLTSAFLVLAYLGSASALPMLAVRSGGPSGSATVAPSITAHDSAVPLGTTSTFVGSGVGSSTTSAGPRAVPTASATTTSAPGAMLTGVHHDLGEFDLIRHLAPGAIDQLWVQILAAMTAAPTDEAGGPRDLNNFLKQWLASPSMTADDDALVDLGKVMSLPPDRKMDLFRDMVRNLDLEHAGPSNAWLIETISNWSASQVSGHQGGGSAASWGGSTEIEDVKCCSPGGCTCGETSSTPGPTPTGTRPGSAQTLVSVSPYLMAKVHELHANPAAAPWINRILKEWTSVDGSDNTPDSTPFDLDKVLAIPDAAQVLGRIEAGLSEHPKDAEWLRHSAPGSHTVAGFTDPTTTPPNVKDCPAGNLICSPRGGCHCAAPHTSRTSDGPLPTSTGTDPTRVTVHTPHGFTDPTTTPANITDCPGGNLICSPQGGCTCAAPHTTSDSPTSSTSPPAEPSSTPTDRSTSTASDAPVGHSGHTSPDPPIIESFKDLCEADEQLVCPVGAMCECVAPGAPMPSGPYYDPDEDLAEPLGPPLSYTEPTDVTDTDAADATPGQVQPTGAH